MTTTFDKDIIKMQKEGKIHTTMPDKQPKDIGVWGRYLYIYLGFRPYIALPSRQ